MEQCSGVVEVTNLVWLCNRDSSWESDWIDFLFEDVNTTGTIVVYNSTADIKRYLKECGPVLGMIHLSDEWGKDPIDHYNQAKIVLRNYYKDLGPNVLNFPLGWMRTFPYTLTPNSIQDRQYVWSFSGHVDKTTRPEMARCMSTVEGGRSYFKKCGENWGPFDGHALDPRQLADLYNSSYFVPCPQGNCSIDSLRVCEALQAGAIPIVERSEYWNSLYGADVPLLQVDSWDHAPALITELTSDLVKLETLRSSIYQWWINYCLKLKATIKELYENS
jgi:hypothetical protein